MTIPYAIPQSRNVPAVKTLEAVGLDESLKFLNRIGINYPEMFYVNAFQVIPANPATNTEPAVKWLLPMQPLPMVVLTTSLSMSIALSSVTEREKTFSNNGSKAMKETTAYMMTDMMKQSCSLVQVQTLLFRGLSGW